MCKSQLSAYRAILDANRTQDALGVAIGLQKPLATLLGVQVADCPASIAPAATVPSPVVTLDAPIIQRGRFEGHGGLLPRPDLVPHWWSPPMFEFRNSIHKVKRIP